MSEPIVIALDSGTSMVKALAFNATGQVVNASRCAMVAFVLLQPTIPPYGHVAPETGYLLRLIAVPNMLVASMYRNKFSSLTPAREFWTASMFGNSSDSSNRPLIRGPICCTYQPLDDRLFQEPRQAWLRWLFALPRITDTKPPRT